MDENSTKGIARGASLTLGPSLPGARPEPVAGATVTVEVTPSKARKTRRPAPQGTSAGGQVAPGPDKGAVAQPGRLVFDSHSSGPVVDKSAHHGALEFGPNIAVDSGPRFDVPGPMMRTVRDPALSLIALSGVDPEGPVMVEIPPVADAGHLSNLPSLACSRIGFANEYVRSDVREMVEHSAHFVHVLKLLRAAGAELVPVHALLVGDTRYFSLGLSNEIAERITENQLDALISDARSPAFHRTCTTGSPRICLHTGLDADGAETSVWFYGAHWAGDRLAALVRSCQHVLGPGGTACQRLFTPMVRI